MDQQYGHVDELKIGGVVIRNWHFNAIDFKNVNNSFSKAQQGKSTGLSAQISYGVSTLRYATGTLNCG